MDLANISLDKDVDNIERMYLLFKVKKEGYGIHIGHVIEIIGLQKIVEVPDVPSYIKGVINLRGQVIPVVDVRLRFNMQEEQYNDRTVIIVVEINNSKTGFIVDGVSEVIELLEEEISPPPQNNGKNNQMITGVGQKNEEICFLLDINKILED